MPSVWQSGSPYPESMVPQLPISDTHFSKLRHCNTQQLVHSRMNIVALRLGQSTKKMFGFFSYPKSSCYYTTINEITIPHIALSWEPLKTVPTSFFQEWHQYYKWVQWAKDILLIGALKSLVTLLNAFPNLFISQCIFLSSFTPLPCVIFFFPQDLSLTNHTSISLLFCLL